MADVLMERGYIYHAMFIYNKPNLKSDRHRNQDFQVSFNVVKYAVDKLASWGFRQTYYHDRDALPGSNIFGDFFDTVKASRYTVVVLTRGFLNDVWGKYESQAAFSKLLQQDKSRRFIVMDIDLEDEQIPDEFNTMNRLSFTADWQSEHDEWERFIQIFTPKVTQPVQDTGQDRFPETHNNSGSDAIPNRRETVQHPQASPHGNNPLAGLQETNPPYYPRDAGPQEPPETTDNLHPENPSTTNRSGNGNPSNQQSGGGYQHSLGVSETQSEDRSVIYQRTSTNGLNSNNSSSTTSSLQVENGQSSTQTGPGQTSSVTTPPTTNGVGRDNGNEDDLSSSLNRSDVEPDNNGRSISIDNQLNTDPLVRQKDEHLNSQPDGGIEKSLDFDSLASGHQDANGSNTSLIGMNRPNENSAPTTNTSDGYKSMDESSENSQGASYVLSKMRWMLPAARSTIRNNMGTMIKHSVKIVLKSDQSYI